MWAYEASYTDLRGSEPTTFYNDGHELAVSIRGVTFKGRDFDMLDPTDTAAADLDSFSLCQGSLCDCTLTWAVRVALWTPEGEDVAVMHARLVLGPEDSRGGLAYENLALTLSWRGSFTHSAGTSGWFEGELNDLQRQLPSHHYVKACINCQFSDYSPYGHGLFGSMLCFRDLRDEYQRVTSKDTFWTVHDRYTELVQETYLCGEFQRRVPGTGYRG
jgi:hypothetical protein